ncbi:MAG TPA: NAD(P)-dependent oxidoreductase, partial [Pirellulaceae bacterium]
MIRVLLADKLSTDVVRSLEQLRLHVDNRPELSADELPTVVAGCDILVVRSTEVTAKTIACGGGLALIVRAGAGVNTIDVAAASQRGIYVANCPGVNSAAVAELAIGLLLAADRRIVDACVDLRNGRWRKKEYGKARGLKGRTLGILGWGAIGRAVADRARALEMRIVAWSRSLTPDQAEHLDIGYAATPQALAAQSDAVSVHLALTPETRHVVNAEFLSAMPEGAILINTSRGELVDTQALQSALATRSLKAAVDVFEDEPEGGDSSFTDKELVARLTATPHIG